MDQEDVELRRAELGQFVEKRFDLDEAARHRVPDAQRDVGRGGGVIGSAAS